VEAPGGTIYLFISGRHGRRSTIYVTAWYDTQPNRGVVRALNRDGSQKWQFPKATDPQQIDRVESSPAIGPDGTVYFGCGDGKSMRSTKIRARKNSNSIHLPPRSTTHDDRRGRQRLHYLERLGVACLDARLDPALAAHRRLLALDRYFSGHRQ